MSAFTISGAGSTTAQKGIREDLAPWITDISREDTPLKSDIGTTTAKGHYHEWQTQELVAASLQAAAESKAFAVSDSVARKRIGNRTQILTKGFRVSGSLQGADIAGIKSEMKEQSRLRGIEMMRDLEKTLVSTQVSTASATASGKVEAGARLMGGYLSFVDNAVFAGTIADNEAVETKGDGSAVPTLTAGDTAGHTSTLGDWSISDLNTLAVQIRKETGARVTTVMGSTANRVKFSEKTYGEGAGLKNIVRNIDDSKKLAHSVEVFVSDAGELMFKDNYLMDDTSIFMYDPADFSLATYRSVYMPDIKEDGDSYRGMLVGEYTLECKNPAKTGAIFGIGASTATFGS